MTDKVIEIEETILVYQKAQLIRWKNKDKVLAEDILPPEDLSIIYSQPSYHFGEVFVLNHYHQEGWNGLFYYALGEQYPGSAGRQRGKKVIEKIFPREKLKHYRELRGTKRETDFGIGEPDLFLYRENGNCMFVEVKKERDEISPMQLRCLALIWDVLGCPIKIVYLREEKQRYMPKTYLLDLDKYEGLLKKERS